MADILDTLGTKDTQLSKVLLELLGSALRISRKKEEKSEPDVIGTCKSVSVSPIGIEVSKSDDESAEASCTNNDHDPTLGRPRYQWQKPKTSPTYEHDRRKYGKSETYSVYVGHLPSDITEGELVDLFKDIGEVVDSFVNPTQQANDYTYGFVRFLSLDQAHEAVREKNMLVLGKRQINVQLSDDTRKKIQNDDDAEELLRKDYPKVTHRSMIRESDDKMVMSKIKSSLCKLQKTSSWGDFTSEEIFGNLRTILKMLINYPMSLADPSADEGGKQDMKTARPNKLQPNTDENLVKEYELFEIPSLNTSGRIPAEMVSVPNMPAVENDKDFGVATRTSLPCPQASSPTSHGSSSEDINSSLMDKVHLLIESSSSDYATMSDDLSSPQNAIIRTPSDATAQLSNNGLNTREATINGVEDMPTDTNCEDGASSTDSDAKINENRQLSGGVVHECLPPNCSSAPWLIDNASSTSVEYTKESHHDSHKNSKRLELFKDESYTVTKAETINVSGLYDNIKQDRLVTNCESVTNGLQIQLDNNKHLPTERNQVNVHHDKINVSNDVLFVSPLPANHADMLLDNDSSIVSCRVSKNTVDVDVEGMNSGRSIRSANGLKWGKRRERALAPSFTTPPACLTGNKVCGTSPSSVQQQQQQKCGDSALFSSTNKIDLPIEDCDPESMELKEQLKQQLRKLEELEKIVAQQSGHKRKKMREMWRENATCSELEYQIHAAEISLQKKKELLSSRITEQELAYEKELLHAVNNTDFSAKLANEMKKDRLRNEISVAQLKCNILEMKAKLLNERDEH